MKKLLKSLLIVKKEKPRVFQVLLLDNDDSQHVEVRGAEQVDYARVKKHLVYDGSVFITSKNSQKIALPKLRNPHRNKSETRKITASYFNHI